MRRLTVEFMIVRVRGMRIGPDSSHRNRHAGALLVTTLSLLLCSPVCAQLFVVNYAASFEATSGGLLAVDVVGAYTFQLTPPDQVAQDATSAYFLNAMASGAFKLNEAVFVGVLTNSYLRVDNNIALGQRFRDGYYGLVTLEGIFAQRFELKLAGLSFEQVGNLPTALNSLALPTSTSDLTGFAESERLAVLVYKDLINGVTSAQYAPVQSFSISQVPEPTLVQLAVLGALGGFWSRRRRAVSSPLQRGKQDGLKPLED